MAQLNTGPPYFAKDAAEANKAVQLQVDVRQRQAFNAQLQARLRGNTQRAIDTLWNWMPVKRS